MTFNLMTGIINLKKVAATAGVLALALIPMLSLAQAPTAPGGIVSPINTVTDVRTVLESILRILYIIFFVVAAIFIVLAAFQYLTAGGEEEKVEKAKKMLIYAVIAIAVALVATGVASVVRGLITPGASIG